MNRTLVVYFSYSNGNTKHIAEKVKEATGADIAEIVPEVEYSGTYDEVVEQGHREVSAHFKPAIKKLPYSIADYDIVAVGTPTWWYTMAPPVLTFLTSNDWNGKKVIPFMTDGGWPGHVIKDIEKTCEGASFSHEKEIRFDSGGGSRMITSRSEVEAWLAELKN